MEHPLFDEILHVERTNSTMRDAEVRIRDGLAQGNFAVVATEQSGGHGRGENHWHSPPGGLWATLALYGLSVPPSLTLFVGVCLHRAISPLLPAGACLQLKWPNDLMLDGRKLAGILTTQMSHKRYHLIGLGVNTNLPTMPGVLASQAASLQLATGAAVDNEALLRAFMDNLAEGLPLFIDQGFDPWLEHYRQHDYLCGKHISMKSEFSAHEGLARGINRSGALLVELPGGMLQPFYAGTVSQVRPQPRQAPEQEMD